MANKQQHARKHKTTARNVHKSLQTPSHFSLSAHLFKFPTVKERIVKNSEKATEKNIDSRHIVKIHPHPMLHSVKGALRHALHIFVHSSSADDMPADWRYTLSPAPDNGSAAALGGGA